MLLSWAFKNSNPVLMLIGKATVASDPQVVEVPSTGKNPDVITTTCIT